MNNRPLLKAARNYKRKRERRLAQLPPDPPPEITDVSATCPNCGDGHDCDIVGDGARGAMYKCGSSFVGRVLIKEGRECGLRREIGALRAQVESQRSHYEAVVNDAAKALRVYQEGVDPFSSIMAYAERIGEAGDDALFSAIIRARTARVISATESYEALRQLDELRIKAGVAKSVDPSRRDNPRPNRREHG